MNPALHFGSRTWDKGDALAQRIAAAFPADRVVDDQVTKRRPTNVPDSALNMIFGQHAGTEESCN